MVKPHYHISAKTSQRYQSFFVITNSFKHFLIHILLCITIFILW
ncbi:hypothetical protein EVA_02461 [gut metagenome]|uniref:Uncharacterized protein n=1 Tax=gut metagenome TaxID=749906 RepID=J9GMZ6_9ZZZZ